MLLESCSSAVVYDKNVWLFIYVKETKFVFGQKQQTFLKQVTTIQLVFYVLCYAINASPQYLKLLNTSEFGENPAVSFCFDFLPRPSKKHKKIPFL